MLGSRISSRGASVGLTVALAVSYYVQTVSGGNVVASSYKAERNWPADATACEGRNPHICATFVRYFGLFSKSFMVLHNYMHLLAMHSDSNLCTCVLTTVVYVIRFLRAMQEGGASEPCRKGV